MSDIVSNARHAREAAQIYAALIQKLSWPELKLCSCNRGNSQTLRVRHLRCFQVLSRLLGSALTFTSLFPRLCTSPRARLLTLGPHNTPLLQCEIVHTTSTRNGDLATMDRYQQYATRVKSEDDELGIWVPVIQEPAEIVPAVVPKPEPTDKVSASNFKQPPKPLHYSVMQHVLTTTTPGTARFVEETKEESEEGTKERTGFQSTTSRQRSGRSQEAKRPPPQRTRRRPLNETSWRAKPSYIRPRREILPSLQRAR